MKKVITFVCIFLGGLNLYSQNGVQAVKGIIIDKQSEVPLLGATIQLISDTENIATITDIDGYFVLDGVPIGRQGFKIDYLGYETLILPNIEVNAGKEVYLNLEMEERLIQLEEVVIKATVDKDKSVNDMATISARQFSMEEVNRYSGGRSDVARLAGNFAGVSTADDSRNDIVIRGNSPTGLLWRLEGIPIPSPNHFSTVGTTGGPVSALNTNMLKNSDFLTSAFPSEYGNALSGVFDLGFRNGNKDEMEYSFQLGAITGFEAIIEGPISKKNNSSFLIAGRYSFLDIAQSIGMDVGTNAVPNYKDLAIKINFGKTPIGNFTLFGVAGNSDIAFLHDEVDGADLFATDDEDAFADSRFSVIGLKHNLLLSDNSYVRTVIGLSGNGIEFRRERYYNIDQSNEFQSPFVKADDGLNRFSVSSYFNKKYNNRVTARAGILIESVAADLSFQSAELGNDINGDNVFDLEEIYRFDETTLLIQPYIQAQYRINENWTINGGLHGMYYDLNEQTVFEPRMAVNWQVATKHKLNFGYGMHHQTQPIPLQVSTKMEGEEFTYPNRSLKFSKSNQFVLGHDYKINDSWRSKIELYYQDISNVPVERLASSFSVLNVGADFGFPIDKNDLINNGSGTNKGLN